MRFLLGLILWSIVSLPALANERPVVRVAVLKIGTVNWELATITANGFDEKHGFKLEVMPFADNNGSRLAVEGGAADVAVADWIWVARQRSAGKDYVFFPYSKAVGGVVVPQDSTAKTLKDLADGKLGIAGGPLDKSWLILRAYAQKTYGIDLKTRTEQVYGAPPLIFKSAIGGDYDGAINYWHFLAKMKASGMKELISATTAAEALGLDPDTPLLGYYGKGSYFDAHPGLAQAFYAASRDAKDVLAGSDAAWEDLRPRMNARTEAQFEQLKTDWVKGIPARGPVAEASAAKMLALMADLGGEELVGGAKTLPDGLFVPVE